MDRRSGIGCRLGRAVTRGRRPILRSGRWSFAARSEFPRLAGTVAVRTLDPLSNVSFDAGPGRTPRRTRVPDPGAPRAPSSSRLRPGRLGRRFSARRRMIVSSVEPGPSLCASSVEVVGPAAATAVLSCPAPVGGAPTIACTPRTPPGPSFAETVDGEVAAFRALVDGPDPLYVVVSRGADCWRMTRHAARSPQRIRSACRCVRRRCDRGRPLDRHRPRGDRRAHPVRRHLRHRHRRGPRAVRSRWEGGAEAFRTRIANAPGAMLWREGSASAPPIPGAGTGEGVPTLTSSDTNQEDLSQSFDRIASHGCRPRGVLR